MAFLVGEAALYLQALIQGLEPGVPPQRPA